MTTLRDIAQEAGVSIMTVSNVLNGNLHKVSAKNTSKINAIIKRVGYTPNSTARSLVARSSKIIAIMIPSACSPNFLEHPYTNRLVSNLTLMLEKAGYFIMIKSFSTPDEISYFIKTWNIDGAVFLGTFTHEITEIKNYKKIPLIFTDSYNSQSGINIRIDDKKGGYLATKHLVSMGHKNIAFLSGEGRTAPSTFKERFEGYKQALEESNLPIIDSHLFETTDDFSGGGTVARKVLASLPEVTAFFCATDILAMGVITCLLEHGKKVPQDYSVVGFDDLPFAPYLSPSLTTVKQNIEKKAQFACDKILEGIRSATSACWNENKSIPQGCTIMDVELVVRNSTSMPRLN